MNSKESFDDPDLPFGEFIKYYIKLSEKNHKFFGARGDFSGVKRGKEEITPPSTSSASEEPSLPPRFYEVRESLRFKYLQYKYFSPKEFSLFLTSSHETLRHMSNQMIWMWNDEKRLTSYFDLPLNEAKQSMLRETKWIHDNLPGMTDVFLRDRKKEIYSFPHKLISKIDSLFRESNVVKPLFNEVECLQAIFEQQDEEMPSVQSIAHDLVSYKPGNFVEHSIELIKSKQERKKIRYSAFQGNMNQFMVRYLFLPYLRMMHTEVTLDLKLNRSPKKVSDISRVFKFTKEHQQMNRSFRSLFYNQKYPTNDQNFSIHHPPGILVMMNDEKTGESLLQVFKLENLRHVRKEAVDSELSNIAAMDFRSTSIMESGFKNEYVQKWEWLDRLKRFFPSFSNYVTGPEFLRLKTSALDLMSKILTQNNSSYYSLFDFVIHPDSLRIDQYVDNLEDSRCLVNGDLLQVNNCIKKPHATFFEILFEILVWKSQVRDVAGVSTFGLNQQPSLDTESGKVFLDFVQILALVSEGVPDEVVDDKRFEDVYVLPVQIDKFYASGLVAEDKKKKLKMLSEGEHNETKRKLLNTIVERYETSKERNKERGQTNLSLLMFHLCFALISSYLSLTFPLSPSFERENPVDVGGIIEKFKRKVNSPLSKRAYEDVLVELERIFLKMVFVYSFFKKSPFTVFPAVNRLLLAEFIREFQGK